MIDRLLHYTFWISWTTSVILYIVVALDPRVSIPQGLEWYWLIMGGALYLKLQFTKDK